MPITPEQMRQARVLLGWSRTRLAALSETTGSFIVFYEDEGRVERMFSRERSFDGLAAIRAALEAAGVEFVDENVDGAGVRLQTCQA